MHKFAFVALIFVLPFVASAHVSVKPAEVGVGAWQTFTVSVPVERDLPTTEVRLIIPEGLGHVTPNVKPGWIVNLAKTGDGEDAQVTEIQWTGGSIPVGMRDEFLFSAQAPATEGTIVWKAYQTYADGSVVSWDTRGEESEEKGPYSETAITNDLRGDAPTAVALSGKGGCDRGEKCYQGGGVLVSMPLLSWIILSLVMSGAALVLGIRSTMRRRPQQ